jgi:hypothetical protein
LVPATSVLKAGTVLTVGWFRVVLATLVVSVSLLWTTPALAQDELDPDPTGVTVLDTGEEAQPESAVVRDEDTSATIRRIRRDLITVAGVMTFALVVYLWHTSPSRRLTVATRRAENIRIASDED